MEVNGEFVLNLNINPACLKKRTAVSIVSILVVVVPVKGEWHGISCLQVHLLTAVHRGEDDKGYTKALVQSIF